MCKHENKHMKDVQTLGVIFNLAKFFIGKIRKNVIEEKLETIKDLYKETQTMKSYFYFEMSSMKVMGVK